MTTAGTAVQGPDLQVNGYVYFTAAHGNTNAVFIGNDGANDITSANGYPLRAGGSSGNQVVRKVNNLQDLWFDAVTNGEKVAYLLMD